MIEHEPPRFTVCDRDFDRAVAIIERSGAAELIDSYYRADKDPGGRTISGIRYTVHAFLVAALIRVMLSQQLSITRVMATIGDFTPSRLAVVGMAGEDVRAIQTDPRSEYRRFHAWLTRRVAPLDPGVGLPARRVTNAVHKAQLASRSQDDRRAATEAAERLRKVINRIVAGSINDQSPLGSCGDLVADESIFDLAGPGAGLGTRPEKYRGASYFGRYYVRDRQTGTISTPGKVKEISKAGFGVGLTAVTRIGRPDAIHAVPPVVVGIDIHPPTSGSVDGLRTALEHASTNGFDNRPGGRARWPYLTVDMGYNGKRGFPELMLEYHYAAVARYPKHWNTVSASTGAGQTSAGPPPGPVQINGAFYCPAVLESNTPTRLPAMRELLAAGGFKDYDEYLSRTLPFLMGLNSRPYQARVKRGRPRIGVQEATATKVDLVCPASLRAVACPLKSDSLDDGPVGVPLARPSWSAHEKACCMNASTTVTLTADQLRLAQWGMVPGSWEHAMYFEAARALTEQRFSQLKSRHVTGLADIKSGPRREPIVNLILALAVAATNDRSQRSHDARLVREESIDIRRRQLTRDLGYEPTRIPPRS